MVYDPFNPDRKEIIIDTVYNYDAVSIVLKRYDCIFRDRVYEVAEEVADLYAYILNENPDIDFPTDKDEILAIFPELPDVVEKVAEEMNKFCD